MHWKTPTEVRDVNAQDNSAWSFNACGREGNGTQVLKKVTCKTCKPLTKQPRTPTQVAAILYQRSVEVASEPNRWVTIACNGCDCHPVDTSLFTYEPQWESIGKIVHLLGHVAHDHAFGTEIDFVIHEVPFTVYELNFAVGKAPATPHEEEFRVRNGWVPAQKELA